MTVRSEVESKLATFASSHNPPIPVAFENVPFTKPKAGNWLEIYFLGEKTINRDLAGEHYATYGMFQVSVYGKLGEGMGHLESLAHEIVALFPMVPKMLLTSVEATPNIGPRIIVDDFVSIPVTVRYRAEF